MVFGSDSRINLYRHDSFLSLMQGCSSLIFVFNHRGHRDHRELSVALDIFSVFSVVKPKLKLSQNNISGIGSFETIRQILLSEPKTKNHKL